MCYGWLTRIKFHYKNLYFWFNNPYSLVSCWVMHAASLYHYIAHTIIVSQTIAYSCQRNIFQTLNSIIFRFIVSVIIFIGSAANVFKTQCSGMRWIYGSNSDDAPRPGILIVAYNLSYCAKEVLHPTDHMSVIIYIYIYNILSCFSYN